MASLLYRYIKKKREAKRGDIPISTQGDSNEELPESYTKMDSQTSLPLAEECCEDEEDLPALLSSRHNKYILTMCGVAMAFDMTVVNITFQAYWDFLYVMPLP
jgi:hypothetical protein